MYGDDLSQTVNQVGRVTESGLLPFTERVPTCRELLEELQSLVFFSLLKEFQCAGKCSNVSGTES